MSQTTFLLLGVTYYVVGIIIIVIVLNFINKKERTKYRKMLGELEMGKNQVAGAPIVAELTKVENYKKDETTTELYEDWKARLDALKKEELPNLTDTLIEAENLFDDKKYKHLKKALAKAELDLYYAQKKSEALLKEIKELTTSKDTNRESITELKARYRKIVHTFQETKESFGKMATPIELQFENIDQLFASFENYMDANNYTETTRILSALQDIVGNLSVVIEEAPGILVLGTKLIPAKMKEVYIEYDKLKKEGFVLEFLNLEYNMEETNKKITEIMEKMNVLNVENATLTLQTIMTYYESLFSEFTKEKMARKKYEEYIRTVLVRANRLGKTNLELKRKTRNYKYSYDLTEDDLKVLDVLKEDIKMIKHDYEEIIQAQRSKAFAYTRLLKEMEVLSKRLDVVEATLQDAIRDLGSLREDEIRGKEQLEEMKEVLTRAKEKMKSYNLPKVPDYYYIELKEANDAIIEMVRELDKKPISIKTVNVRVDTARDLVLKVYNSSKEIIKTAYMVEMSIVYGNRHRSTHQQVDEFLTKAEKEFSKGNYKKALQYAIDGVEVVEKDYSQKLLDYFKNQ